MRIERILADSFGPFVGQELALAPGFTIVLGPNESGKSSWHAALYVAVCGTRRSRGAGTKEDKDFEALHRPWDHPGWEVRAVLVLEDGRRVEMHQDLQGRVDCSALDALLGRDISSEIMNGTPDASMWLGLDRRSFLATACIQQADLLGILSEPGLLQEHMQRAAATAGADATAASAISRVEEFRKEHVGADMVHSRKPLRAAKDKVQSAERALREAQEAHARFSELAASADRARKRAEESEHHLAVVKTAVEKRAVEDLRARLDRAKEIAARYPGGPPAGPAESEDLALEVATVLHGWETRPEPVAQTGRTAFEIREEIEELPEVPPGDTESDPAVVSAHDDHNRARQALELQGSSPPEPVAPETWGLGDQDLMELARDLELHEPPVEPSLEAEATEARAAVESAGAESRRVAPLVIASAGLVLGVVLVLSRLVVVGSVIAAGATLAGGWWMASADGRSRSRLQAMERLREAELALGEDRFRGKQVQAKRRVAEDRARSAGLDPDPAMLRQMASDLVSFRTAMERLDEWRSKAAKLESDAESAAHRLAAALQDRGAALTGDPVQDFKTYAAECRTRDQASRRAQSRPTLEASLRTRRELEDAAASAEQTRADAASLLQDLAGRIGAPPGSDEVAEAALHAWQEEHAEDARRAEAAVREWTELENILAGNSVDEFESLVDERSAHADAAAKGLDPQEMAAVLVQGDGRLQVEDANAEADRHRREAERLAGSVEADGARLPSVPEAEETLAGANRELTRVERLQRTLETTLQFLEDAQDRVHRDIAPALASAVRRWLPALTAGRYTDAVVDPATLKVRVQTKEGKSREAKRLSQGTREQIYLLLRVALAEHLARPGEVIPLILDDVTAHCDAARTESLLGILHEVSRTRQVVLFTQDQDVGRWADAHLDPARDLFVQLDSSRIPA